MQGIRSAVGGGVQAASVARYGKKVVTRGTLLASALLLAVPSVAFAQNGPGECKSPAPGEPVLVDATCVDPVFNSANFVIDSITAGVVPQAHTKVVGHFKAAAGTPDISVSIYYPPADKWQGRFFQHVYPLEEPENLEHVALGLSSGGYYIKVRGVPAGGHRLEAGAAKWAKEFARKFYKTDRPIYGYFWGGSGGGQLSVSAIENTQDVWQGAVPYVLPNSNSIATTGSMGALTSLALRDKSDAIRDAFQIGGNGDPRPALNEEERAIFDEALGLGSPRQGFQNGVGIGGGGLGFFVDGVRANDPTYVTDFWSKPGYEGTNPPEFLKRALIDETVAVARVVKDERGTPTAIEFDKAPTLGPRGAAGLDYSVVGPDGAVQGKVFGSLNGTVLTLAKRNPNANPLLGGNPTNSAELLARIAPGSRVKIDNRFSLALAFYHRHTLPPARDMYIYDRYRNADGSPRYAQRPASGGVPTFGGGGSQTGRIRMKVISIQNLLDGGAAPWVADWYSKRVRRELGEARYNDNFRVYYNDNAEHLDIHSNQHNFGRVVWYVPSLYQSLRDLSAWVERGVAPPPSSGYRVDNSQVYLAETAAARRGIQPVVTLTANGRKSVEVAVNQPVTFSGKAAAPPQAGLVTSTAWSFGEDEVMLARTPVAKPLPEVAATRTHAFAKPGTYLVTFGATSQRDGKVSDTLTSIENLDRVRVIVR